MKVIFFAMACMTLLLGGRESLATEQPKDAFVVLAVGDGVSSELADDVTEAVTFAVGSQNKLNFLPKEKLQQQLGYQSPAQTGNCVFDNECLRRVRKSLGVRWFVVARLSRVGASVQIVVTQIAGSGPLDVQASGQAPSGASDIINKVRMLLLRVLVRPQSTLAISPSHPDGQVFVDGKKVGTGNVVVKVTPGPHMVRVSKIGFTTFKASVDCGANSECVVAAKLVPSNESNYSGTIPMRDTGRIWRIMGWTSAGVGSGLVIIAAIAASQSSGLEDELNDACASKPCSITRTDAKSKTNKGERAALVAQVSGSIGALLLAGGATAIVMGYLKRTARISTGREIQLQPFLDGRGNLGLNATLRF
jgi:hypothetical protein